MWNVRCYTCLHVCLSWPENLEELLQLYLICTTCLKICTICIWSAPMYLIYTIYLWSVPPVSDIYHLSLICTTCLWCVSPVFRCLGRENGCVPARNQAVKWFSSPLCGQHSRTIRSSLRGGKVTRPGARTTDSGRARCQPYSAAKSLFYTRGRLDSNKQLLIKAWEPLIKAVNDKMSISYYKALTCWAKFTD